MSILRRKAWDPDRRFVVTVGSKWRREGSKETWQVTDLWRFEQGSGRELLAVTIKRGTKIRRLSQARLLGSLHEIT